MPFFQTLLPPALRAPRAGAIFEWRADTAAIDLGRCVADNRGAGLVIDYGHTETGLGETLQAVGQHAYADPLTFPGSLDLTAHVDFQSLARAVEAMGARVLDRSNNPNFCGGLASNGAPPRLKPIARGPAKSTKRSRG